MYGQLCQLSVYSGSVSFFSYICSLLKEYLVLYSTRFPHWLGSFSFYHVAQATPSMTSSPPPSLSSHMYSFFIKALLRSSEIVHFPIASIDLNKQKIWKWSVTSPEVQGYLMPKRTGSCVMPCPDRKHFSPRPLRGTGGWQVTSETQRGANRLPSCLRGQWRKRGGRAGGGGCSAGVSMEEDRRWQRLCSVLPPSEAGKEGSNPPDTILITFLCSLLWSFFFYVWQTWYPMSTHNGATNKIRKWTNSWRFFVSLCGWKTLILLVSNDNAGRTFFSSSHISSHAPLPLPD